MLIVCLFLFKEKIDEVLSKFSMRKKVRKFVDLINTNKATKYTLKFLSSSNLNGRLVLYCKIFRQISKYLLLYKYLDSSLLNSGVQGQKKVVVIVCHIVRIVGIRGV